MTPSHADWVSSGMWLFPRLLLPKMTGLGAVESEALDGSDCLLSLLPPGRPLLRQPRTGGYFSIFTESPEKEPWRTLWLTRVGVSQHGGCPLRSERTLAHRAEGATVSVSAEPKLSVWFLSTQLSFDRRGSLVRRRKTFIEHLLCTQD